ncbi:apolipoprotein L3-like [Hippopotamus amphibius kiboko]|uniref:apolipoprotein L3-like n=1 Tax=Hippopotamus amphibius kiboko TaxID=575201 RepID=UPI0025940EC0|nr:apolipoprotein L3-like [Hippopotamus amphibius kiboko]
MSSGNLGDRSESKSFLEDVTEYFREKVSREELEHLLTEDKAWESFVAEADLSREEADALREHLNKLKTDLAVGDQDTLQQDQVDRMRFLEAFPQVKWELEEQIGKLQALADNIDKAHRKYSTYYMVANSTGAVSGVLRIFGMTLAPVTAGSSLAVSAIGLALGAAAAVASVSTSIMEHRSTSAAETEASRLMSTGVNREAGLMGALGKNTPQIVFSAAQVFRSIRGIGKNVRAIKLARANPGLAACAVRFMTTGKVSVQSANQVRKAFGGTPLAMTRKARVMGTALAGAFLLVDVFFLVQDAKRLLDGAGAESAERLRLQAHELEKKVEELTCIYKHLC